ncbi:3-keto-disaccharide hydrolase [Rubritalea profundi]|nr:DUF1080 domain-containing protein [Rubritalea profundi]
MRLLILITILLPLSLLADPSSWTPLFNGKDLTGWHTMPGGKWEIVNGVITGTSKKEEKRHGLLVSDKTYNNIILRAKFKVTSGDSGLYFRALKTNTQVAIKCFQAEVDKSPKVGGLYETSGRSWVKNPDPQRIAEIVKHGDWNQITVSAIGDDITVSLNGLTVTELLADTQCQKEGRIALQLHGGEDMHVEFKDLALLEIK